MNRVEKFLCLVSRSDPDLYGESNAFDRRTIGANAIALLTSGVVAAIAWAVFWASFIPLWPALALAFLIALIIIQLDAAMGASDWELAGALRTKRPKLSHWFQLALRVVVALLLAHVTAVGVTLVMYSDAIENHIQNQRTIKNSVVEKDYEKRKKAIRADVISALDYELETTQEERSRAVEELGGLRAKRKQVQAKADDAFIEAGREEDGLDRPGGPGPRYRDAMRQQEIAKSAVAGLTEEIHQKQAAIEALDSRVETLSERIISGKQEMYAQWQVLDTQKPQDARWVPERDDPLLRYVALQELKQHPVYGAAVREFDMFVKILLVTLELIFLLIKVVFTPASVYMVRLLAKHKREAAEIANAYSRSIYAIRSGLPSAQLRIVGGRSDQ